MVNPLRNHHLHLAATLLVSLLILLSLSSISSARPLNDFSHLATTSSNLALPTDRTAMPEKEGHVSGVYYGPLILNMLPKGKITPSGPSKGTNNLNN
ncbi:hypothetical protein P8452_22624 [Trifolium repens]|jgi:hypothetical protein|nr:hypothetical protein P8452_22624 [Trifolium repens]